MGGRNDDSLIEFTSSYSFLFRGGGVGTVAISCACPEQAERLAIRILQEIGVIGY